ncbi:unnamed protein product [Owenia fusiformis]|uniref:Succinate-semialdehyde dehydrogenase n=1 Tax=Owenia fusiformis TaxID=6347 RepID=A0A8J1T4E6_OWEFU|nr:unnamed protein product [Owenia fusiformis]
MRSQYLRKLFSYSRLSRGRVEHLIQTGNGSCVVSSTRITGLVSIALTRQLSSTGFTKHDAYIDGKWIPADNGDRFKVTNPATGEVISHVPNMGEIEATRAIERAGEAFQTWRKYTGKERSSILYKWHSLIVEHHMELARLLTTENGKPLSDATTETLYGASFLEWFSGEARRMYGDVIPTPAANKRILAIKQPIGVASLICPWNFPVAMVTRKAGAALAAGCSIVIKPAEDTPLCSLALTELAEEAGVPPGVLNVVTCSRENAPSVGKVMCEHPLVGAVSFTGSTDVGKILLEQSAKGVKKCSMELGGNAAFIVFNSAKVDKAVAAAVASKFRCSGQTCVCTNRILVQDGVYEEFVAKFTNAVEALAMGNGLDEGINLGPVINQRAVEKVERLVNDAVSKGSMVKTGGKRHKKGGNFYEATVLTNINETMEISREEIFGPVAPIIRFQTEEEAVRVANSTSYGLAGYFFTEDMSQLWRVAEKLEVGMIGINDGLITASTVEAPLGGVKQSGLGREGSKYGVDEFTELKYLCIGGITD